jgi:hypothetical protein
MQRCTRDHQVGTAARSCTRASVVEKLRTASARKHCRGSLGLARDRLFDSAPSSAVSRDKSVKRSAQDDDFVGVLKKHSKQVSAYGTASWVDHANRDSIEFFRSLQSRFRCKAATYGLRGCVRTEKKPQISPLRCTPVEMTNLLHGNCQLSSGCTPVHGSTNLSSRPDPDFLPRSAGRGRVCCVRQGKQHEAANATKFHRKSRGSAPGFQRFSRCSTVLRRCR